MAFDTAKLTKARESGYSDEEITSFVAQEDPKFKTAIDSGYSIDEVAGYFDPKEQPKQSLSELSSRVLSSAAESTIQAATMAKRIAQETSPLGRVGEFLQEKITGMGNEALLTEMEGAASRAKDDFGVDPKFNDTMMSAVASGVGSIGPIIASGPMAPLTGSLMASEQGLQEAEEMGATGLQKYASAAGKGATAFVTEKLLGLPKIFKIIKHSGIPAKTLGGKITGILKQGGLGAAMEGGQEGIEQIIGDALSLGYDPDRKVFDWKKILKSVVAGSVVGTAVSGGLKTIQTISPESINPKEIAPKTEMQDAAQSVDESLAQMATEIPPNIEEINQRVDREVDQTIAATEAPPTETFIPTEQVPQGPPVTPTENAVQGPPVTAEEGVPEPAITPAEITPPTEEEAPAKLSPFEPKTTGPQIISTGILGEDGVPVTGKDWNSGHATIVKQNPELALMDELENRKGFIIQDAEGNQKFVGRKQALEIARASGQVDESSVRSAKAEGLISEALVEPKPKTQDVVPPKAQTQEEIAKKTADELQKYQKEAIEVARQAGATDPQTAFSIAQETLAKKGNTDKAFLMKIVKRTAFNQARNVKQVELAPEPTQERGPRAEAVSEEAVSQIHEAIKNLPEAQSKVFTAKLQNPNRTNAELAEDLGMTEGSVRMAISRGRETLANFIREQGIGERMGPGAANEREFMKARHLIASSIYGELKGSGTLSREEFTDRMQKEYEDVFTQEQIDQAFDVAQEVNTQFEESDGRKPLPVIIDQLMGKPIGEGETALKNAQNDLERAARNLPEAKQSARRSDPQLWDQAQQAMEQDPYLQDNIIARLNADPRTTLNDLELMVLLDAKITAEIRYDSILERLNKATTEQEKLTIKNDLIAASERLTNLYDIAKQVGSEQGRAFRARRLLVSRDFSVGRLSSELQAAKGEKLSESDLELIQKVSKTATDAQSALDTRIDQLETTQATKHAEDSLKSMQAKLPLDKRILEYANKIVAQTSKRADNARQRLRKRAGNLNMALNPMDFADSVIIGVDYIARGLRAVAWKVAMRNELNEIGVQYEESDLDRVFDEADKQLDSIETLVPEKDRASVKAAVRKTGTRDVLKDTTQKLKARIEDGKSITELRSYVQKIALAFVRGGVNSVEGLTDAVHGILTPLVPGITKRQTMDLWSGYGDFTKLDKDSAKQTLRDLKGQGQSIAKIEDILSRKPISATGFERPKKSDKKRRLEREVNELKKKHGVVVTDPETQLKSALDTIKTGLRNQLSDLTHQIETGEKPLPGVPAPSTSEIEALKALRDRVRETIRQIEGTPKATEEQRVKAAENALEKSIADLETRIKNKDTKSIPGAQPQSAKLDALRARRDMLQAEMETLKAADTDLQNTKAFDRVMKSIDELQGKLDRGEVKPTTKAEKIEDELVTQARDQLKNLQDQMRLAKAATPEAEQARVDAAIKAVERSISAYDARLKSGALTPTPGAPKVSSPVLERLRAERDAMSKLVQELRKGPALTPEQASMKALKARLARQIQDTQERIARGDFARKPARRPYDLSKDPEAVRLTAERNRVMEEFNEKRQKYEEANMSALQKTFMFVRHRADDVRSTVGSFDISAFARQALKATASHPIVAFRNLITSIQSMSEGRLNQENAKLELRKNALNGVYKMMKLDFTGLKGPLAKQEESFRSTWAKKLPWVKFSERQFVTFLNLMRADLADMLVAAAPVNPTPEQLRAIGRSVNIATGRGDLGKFSGAADASSVLLWSPRLYASRLQTLVAYDVLHNDSKGVRKILIKEYFRAASTGVAVMTLGALMGADVEWDKDSSDFMKLRFGNTRVDPWGGMQQWLVFLARMIGGGYKTSKGKEFDMSYPDRRPGPYDPTYGDTASRMFRSKLNPVAGGMWELRTGKDIQGNRITPGQVGLKMVLPLSIYNDDIIPIAKEHGIGAAAAAQLLNMSGVGIQHYTGEQGREKQR